MSEENTTTTETTPAPQENPNAAKGFPKAALAVLPFAPAPISGKDAWIGWTRIAGYTAISYWAWSKKQRTLAYAFMGATALSAATSLSAKAWNG